MRCQEVSFYGWHGPADRAAVCRHGAVAATTQRDWNSALRFGLRLPDDGEQATALLDNLTDVDMFQMVHLPDPSGPAATL